ncbi:MAG: hypothetical protein ACREUG_09455, partial [Steroidobacteraceae bacterium]
MTELEVRAPFSPPPLLDLNVIDEALRAPAWLRCAQHCFPGLAVRDLRPNPALGVIAGSPVGTGRLWT